LGELRVATSIRPDDAAMRQDIPESADTLLANERARWPHWRNSASKPAPPWFRGHELDVIDAEDRRRLFREVDAQHPAVEWTQLLALAILTPMCLRGLHAESAAWAWGIAAIAWSGVLAGTIRLRRHNIMTTARRVVRERADWPQRLHALTS
jgi:hypothetical protein